MICIRRVYQMGEVEALETELCLYLHFWQVFAQGILSALQRKQNVYSLLNRQLNKLQESIYTDSSKSGVILRCNLIDFFDYSGLISYYSTVLSSLVIQKGLGFFFKWYVTVNTSQVSWPTYPARTGAKGRYLQDMTVMLTENWPAFNDTVACF